MCIMAYHKPGVPLPSDDILERCWDKNPHGGGFAFIKQGKIAVSKHMEKKDFIADIKKARAENPDVDFIWHVRAASHGVVTIENCHPFIVKNSYVFAHNGHINDCSTSKTDERSDTRFFAEDILGSGIHESMLANEEIQTLLEDYIGHSKLLFLTKKHGCIIINEKKGEWHNDIWYSNDGYKESCIALRGGYQNGYSSFKDEDWHRKGYKCPCNPDKERYSFEYIAMYSADFRVALMGTSCTECRQSLFTDLNFAREETQYYHLEYKCNKCLSTDCSANGKNVYVLDLDNWVARRFCLACFWAEMMKNEVSITINEKSRVEDMFYEFWEGVDTESAEDFQKTIGNTGEIT